MYVYMIWYCLSYVVVVVQMLHACDCRHAVRAGDNNANTNKL